MANAPTTQVPMGGMMAPSFYQQMAGAGNQMLQEQGMQPYTPMQSPYFSNDFVQNHPQLSGALGGALGVLGNMGPTPMVSGFGEGLSRLAQGVAGNAMMQRQWQQQQAMMPMQIAQSVMGYRKNAMEMQKMQAPEFIQGKYGNTFTRDPLTGEVKPGPNQNSTGMANADGVFGQLKAMFPGADENVLRGYAQSNAQIPDPEKRAEHLQTAMTNINGDLRQRQVHADNEAMRQQQFEANEVQRQIANQLAQNKYDDARNDLIPQAVQTQMSASGLMDNLNRLEQKIAPLKGNNWPGTFLWDRLQYAAGHAPKGSLLEGNDIAAAAVNQVQGGAMWMRAAGTRNPMVFQKAQEHIFDPWKDSPDNALEKIQNLKKNIIDMYNEAGTLGHKHNYAPTQMDASGTVVNQGDGSPVNFNPNPMFAPGMGGNAPAPVAQPTAKAKAGKYDKYKVTP
jgi:type II secretory pathway component PulJ